MVKFLSVSGVNTETHPEINTHILNFPSQKGTPPTHMLTHTCRQAHRRVSTQSHMQLQGDTHSHTQGLLSF